MNYVKNTRGFTLIELLIVIAVIGILAVITIVAFQPQEIFANGRNSRRVQDVSAINSAIGQWLAREGRNDTDVFGTLGLTDNGVSAVDDSDGITSADGVAATTVTEIVDAGYLSQGVPTDPSAGATGYRIGVDDVTTPTRIFVCTGDIEITDVYPASQYPNNVFCLSN